MITAREPRVVISRRPTRRDHLHGAWWPRSTDVRDELEPMLEAVGPRFRAVVGVMLNGSEWPSSRMAERPASIGKARISWYGLAESHLAVLRCDSFGPIALLVLPPETPERVALTATLLASTPGNVLGTEETMSKARAMAGSGQNL